MKNPKLPPGPRGIPFLGNLLERRKFPLELYGGAAREFGDIVHIPMAHINAILLTHPDHVRHVLQDRLPNYHKGRPYDGLRRFLGNGLLTSEGDHWRKQRRLVQPAFHRPALNSLIPIMDETIREWLPDWSPGPNGPAQVDLYSSMMKLTLEIAARTLFGSSLGAEKERLSEVVSILIRQANDDSLSIVFFPPWVPTRRNRRVKKALSMLDGILFRAIGERLKPGAPQQADFLGRLVAARDEETSVRMSERELRDEVMNFFIAGHETTATAMSWLLYLLSRHPEVVARLEKEADALSAVPTVEELLAMPYTAAVIKEGLRLYPPAWLIPRQAREADVIDGFDIPAGAIALISPYLLHRHPKYWKDPERFDPERFLNGAEPIKNTYIPFSVGPRSCIGSVFASAEMALMIGRILRHYRIQTSSGLNPVPEPLITLRPKNGIPAKIIQRSI